MVTFMLQLEEKAAAERKLQEILEKVELENAKLVMLNKEDPDHLSPAARATLNRDAGFGI